MNMDNDISLVCVGEIMTECMMRLPALPTANTTVILDAVHQELGGPAFNICWHLSNLACKPLLVSPFGRYNIPLITESFAAAQLDDSGLIGVEGDSDALITLLVNQDFHSIYLRSSLPVEIVAEMLTRCGKPKRLILAGGRHSIVRDVFCLITETFQGDFLAFNPSYSIYEFNESQLAYLLGKADAAILNQQEAQHACNVLDVKNCNDLSKLVAGCLILTLGEKGVRVYQPRGMLEMASYAKNVANTIGAGDAFIAGFLHETFRGVSPKDAVLFGSVLSAYTVESLHVRVFVTEHQIRERMKEYSTIR